MIVSEGDIITVLEYQEMLDRINNELWRRVGDGLDDEHTVTGNLRQFVQDESGQFQPITFDDGDVIIGGIITQDDPTDSDDEIVHDYKGINFLIDELSIIDNENLPDKVEDNDYIVPTTLIAIDNWLSIKENTDMDADSASCTDASCAGTCYGNCWSSCNASCSVGCRFTCEGTCIEDCSESCQNQCVETCKTICSDSCESTCTLVCKESCNDSCTVTCQDGCKTKCTTGCKGQCKGGCEGCTANCKVSCGVACTGGCSNGCSSSCKGQCKGHCTYACQLFCKQNCEGKADSYGYKQRDRVNGVYED